MTGLANPCHGSCRGLGGRDPHAGDRRARRDIDDVLEATMLVLALIVAGTSKSVVRIFFSDVESFLRPERSLFLLLDNRSIVLNQSLRRGLLDKHTPRPVLWQRAATIGSTRTKAGTTSGSGAESLVLLRFFGQHAVFGDG